MRLYWIKIGSKSKDLCSYKKRREHTDTHREGGHVKTEAGLDWHSYKPRNAKNGQESPEARKR